MRLQYITISILIFLFIVAPCGATTEYPEDIAAQLQQKYDSLDSLAFDFKQQSSGEMSGRPIQGCGNAIFYRAKDTSKMRWNYNEPDIQVLVSDGTTFSMYFKELAQMIVTPAKALDTELTYAFFSGQNRIEELFHIRPPDPEYLPENPEDGRPRAIKLIPIEEHSQVQNIHLWVDDETLIRRIEIKDHFNTITVLNFGSIKENPLAAQSPQEIETLFSFTPPAGTEIIRQ